MNAPPFAPPAWLSNAHLQTIGASLPFFSTSPIGDGGEHRLVPIADARGTETGGALHVAVHWQAGGAPRPLVVVVHGVGGSSASRYVVRAAAALHAAGYHVARLDLRGAGPGIAHAPSLYHAGLTADPAAAVRHFSADPRVASVALLGFSLGGNCVLKLAGEWGDAPPAVVRGVASVSAPIDLLGASRELERLRTFPYRAYVVRHLVAYGRAFARLHPAAARYDLGALAKIRSITEYDALVTAPMHGFDGTRDYYTKMSAGPGLARVTVPSLVVHADDDPMVPGRTVRPHLASLPPAVRVAWSRSGGHVGWFGGMNERHWHRTWAMDRVIDFFDEVTRA